MKASIFAVLTASILTAFTLEAVEIIRADGGSVQTDLGFNIKVNSKSTLRREYVAVVSNLPVSFLGAPGVTTIYEAGKNRYASGNYKYASKSTVVAGDALAVTAFEVRFVTFGIFGNRVRTLSATVVEDIPAGERRTYDWKWRLHSENEVSEHFASVAFVAQVRTADGQVHVANQADVLEAVRQFAVEATEADLNPTAEKP